MYIESLHIGDFGGTCNRDIAFENKVNIMCSFCDEIV